MSHPTQNPFRKALIRGLLVVLWIPVLWLGLFEMPCMLRLKYIERTNRFIVPQKTSHVEDLAPPELHRDPPWTAPSAITWATDIAAKPLAKDDFCSWGASVDDDSDAAFEKRAACFPSLNEHDRLDFAAATMQTIAQYDTSGKVVNVYGEEYGSYGSYPKNDFTVLLRDGPKTSGMHYKDVAPSFALRYCLLSEAGGTFRYIFLDAKKRNVDLAPMKPLPTDSPWEEPFIKYKPNLRSSHSGMGEIGFRTNNLGYRGADIEVPKPSGVFRIICLGGSTTEESHNGESYPSMLQGLLLERFPGRRIEVVNCGISGKATPWDVALLGDYFKMEPDLILIYDGINDVFQHIMARLKEQAGLSRKASQWSWFVHYCGIEWLFCTEAEIDACIDACTMRNFGVIRRASACRGIPIALCSQAMPDRKVLTKQEREYFDHNARTGWSYPELSLATYCRVLGRLNVHIRSFCEREHVLYVPVNENMGGGMYYFRDICHMHVQGIMRKAEIVERYLKDYLSGYGFTRSFSSASL